MCFIHYINVSVRSPVSRLAVEAGLVCVISDRIKSPGFSLSKRSIVSSNQQCQVFISSNHFLRDPANRVCSCHRKWMGKRACTVCVWIVCVFYFRGFLWHFSTGMRYRHNLRWRHLLKAQSVKNPHIKAHKRKLFIFLEISLALLAQIFRVLSAINVSMLKFMHPDNCTSNLVSRRLLFCKPILMNLYTENYKSVMFKLQYTQVNLK